MPDSTFIKWFTPHIGIKRWLMMTVIGIFITVIGMSLAFSRVINTVAQAIPLQSWWTIVPIIVIGIFTIIVSMHRLLDNILAPYRRQRNGRLIDVVTEHNRRRRGTKFVAIGGGTGLPATLRALKPHSGNITAIVTVADDGGSSGRLRRDMGVPPPGDLRNNIAALADDDSLMTRLFQYRFEGGDLDGHSFGNLFIAALASISQAEDDDRGNSLARALVEVERVLNIQGRVLPATLEDVHLTGEVQLSGSGRVIRVRGESQIGSVDGSLQALQLDPANIEAYPPSIQAIRDADVIIIGPGSLYTSILPNLMVEGIADALRATEAYKIYVCNVATQPVETEDYTVAEHVLALEKHIGRGVFHAVLANDHYPQKNAGVTQYVARVPDSHEIQQRYEICYTDLTDAERPWRHDPDKLGRAILMLSDLNRDKVLQIKHAG